MSLESLRIKLEVLQKFSHPALDGAAGAYCSESSWSPHMGISSSTSSMALIIDAI